MKYNLGILLSYLVLIILFVALTLDGYVSKIVPDVLIFALIFVYFVILYRNYVSGVIQGSIIQNYIAIDANDRSTRRQLFLLNLCIASAPTYILTHSYETTGPPAFFPVSVFPLLIICFIVLLILRNDILKDYKLYQLCMYLFLLDMIVTSQLPSRPESINILYFRLAYTSFSFLIILELLLRVVRVKCFHPCRCNHKISGDKSQIYQGLRHNQNQNSQLLIDHGGDDVQLRNNQGESRGVVTSCVLILMLLMLSITQSISLFYQGGWVWNNYKQPDYNLFPHNVFIGPTEGTYLPIVGNSEYRYSLLPVGSNPFLTVIENNTTRCSGFETAPDSIIPVALWITAKCEIIPSALDAQDAGYSVVIFRHVTQNLSDILVNENIKIPLFTLGHESFNTDVNMVTGTEVKNKNMNKNTGKNITNQSGEPIGYTVITREFKQLWSYPISYLILLAPVICGLVVLSITSFISVYRT